MGCGSSTPTSTAPKTKSRNQNDVILTSEVTEQDFDSSGSKSKKTSSQTNGTAQHIKPKSNGTTQHQVQQQNTTRQHQIQQQNGSAKSSSGVNVVISAKSSSSDRSRKDDIIVENVEEIAGDNVKPKPSRKKKAQIMSDPEMFKTIDSHVARTPASVCSSIPTLTEYLIKPARTPLERARAIYKWVTTNIAYDVDGYMGRSEKKSCDSGNVLQSRTSVCSGYSNLFESLCRCAHVPVMVINGYAKGFSHKNKDEIDLSTMQTNHAWNAIFVEGEWRLMDCTWDAGYIDGKSFHWRKKDYYFLMDPEYFISTHLPYTNNDLASSESWQLLDKPVDPKTFFKSVKLEEGSVNFGVFPRSHKDTIIHMTGEVCIEIQKFISGEIEDTLLTFKNEEGTKEYKECVATERSGNDVIKFHVRPPQAGNYKLSLFIYAVGEKKEWPQLFDYEIKCDKVMDNLVPFPDYRQIYGPKPEYKELGFGEGVKDHSFYTTNSGEVEIVLPTLRQMSVLCTLEDANSNKIQNAVFQQSTESSIFLSARFPQKGYYKLIIFAEKENKHVVGITYMINCTNVIGEFMAYPVQYGGKATQYRVILHEPKVKLIPAKSTVVFRFSSPVLKSVQVGSKVFKKTNDKDDWEVTVETPEAGSQVNLFGSDEESGTRSGLFGYITK